jgi:N-methylhydantoinase A
VSAGGGSIAWADAGGALRVGPQSAGAEPGPAAYDAGGEDATVTDANLFLGYLADGATLGGEVVLKRERAEAALERLGSELGLDAEQTALGIVRVANAEMVRALRVISVERGLDPREFALVAFGGAGAMHACALADELQMRTVVVPKAAGVLSALGLAISDVRRDYVEPLLSALDELEPERLEKAFATMEERGREDLEEPDLHRAVDVRYRGQSFELTVEADAPDELAERFHDRHEQRYGYRMDDEPVEVVNVRLTATVAVEKPELREADDEGSDASDHRRACFEEDWSEVDVHDRTAMGAGAEVSGPALVEFPEATCVVAPGWSGRVDEAGGLVLEREAS